MTRHWVAFAALALALGYVLVGFAVAAPYLLAALTAP